MEKKTLGILGGVGPLATVYFADLLVRLTDAKTDQEHLDTIIFNHASIPDRTRYILDRNAPNPVPVMQEDARKLREAGCDMLAIPCNTAHAFYDEIQRAAGIPVIDLIEETVRFAMHIAPNLKTLGILATEGTIRAEVYPKAAARFGIACKIPGEKAQRSLMRIIYDEVKAGKEADVGELLRIVADMKKQGCGAVVLGCTELSVICRDFKLTEKDDKIADALEVLARRCIELCGKKRRSSANDI